MRRRIIINALVTLFGCLWAAIGSVQHSDTLLGVGIIVIALGMTAVD